MKIPQRLKKLLDDLNAFPRIKNILLGVLIYFLITLIYSNITWESLRSKLTFLNRMFYSSKLSIKEHLDRRKKIIAEDMELQTTKVLVVKSIIKTPSITLSGVIEPLEKIEVYSKISGRVEKFFVTKGEKIKEGQKLAKIDSMNLELELKRQEAALESSKAQVKLSREKYDIAKRNIEIRLNEADKKMIAHKKAQVEFHRASELFNKKQELLNAGAIPVEEFETTKIDYLAKESAYSIASRDLHIGMLGLRDEDIEKAGISIPSDKKSKIEVIRDINTRVEKSELEVAEKNRDQSLASMKITSVMLGESVLYSPINGVVASRAKSIGELVDAGGTTNSKSIMTLVYIDSVYASFFINEFDSTQVKENIRVNVRTDVYPDKVFIGKVKIVSPIVDQKTHTTEIKVLLENKDHSLKPGMFVRLEVITGKPTDMISIPYESVLPAEENNGYVYQVKEKTIFKTKVKLGKKENDSVEILDGLKDSDQIAISNFNRLRDGMIINPISE